MKKILILALMAFLAIAMIQSASAWHIAPTWEHDKCVCAECALVQGPFPVYGSVSVQPNTLNSSAWLCDSCLCPWTWNPPTPVNYTVCEDVCTGMETCSKVCTNYLPGWYLIAEDVCITKTIKWKTFGWILAVHGKCSNLDKAFGRCTVRYIEGNRVVDCGYSSVEQGKSILAA